MDHWLSSMLPLLPLVAATLPPEVLRDPATPDLLSKVDLDTILYVADTLTISQMVNGLIGRIPNQPNSQSRSCDV